jgi:hypothetical protein
MIRQKQINHHGCDSIHNNPPALLKKPKFEFDTFVSVHFLPKTAQG